MTAMCHICHDKRTRAYCSATSVDVGIVMIITIVILIITTREDRLYCDQCYKEQFVPRCAKCQDFITSVTFNVIIVHIIV